MSFPHKAILFDWAYTLVDLVCEDDRAAFLELMKFLKDKGVELPEFELIFSAYQDLFYGLLRNHAKLIGKQILKLFCGIYFLSITLRLKIEPLGKIY